MTSTVISKLPDADMQAAPAALLRAALRAREIVRQARTPIVIVLNGELLEDADDSRTSEIPT